MTDFPQLVIEVVAALPVASGDSAHRRGAYDKASGGAWPACVKKPSGSWRELSAGRAQQLGLQPCTAKACFPPGTEATP